MTRQETFKRRIRARMAKTGERYVAARRHLMTQQDRRSRWVAQPEISDEAVFQATGKGWEEWREILDIEPGPTANHSQIVEHLATSHKVDGWWAQAVAVGYERIAGIRLPHQKADGTFTAGKSRTLDIDGESLREMLFDSEARADLFPGFETELRSRPTTRAPRIAIGPGVALFSIEPKDKVRSTVTINHEKLPTVQAVDEWKAFWAEWLEALAES